LWHLSKYGSTVEDLITWPGGTRMIVLPHRPGWPKQVAYRDVKLNEEYHPKRAKACLSA
jgi:hypothetical protein